MIGSIAHFAAIELEMRIVPAPRTRRIAGIGLFALTIAVTPANVSKLEHYERFDMPRWMLIARLPLQALLLALIAWSMDVFSQRRGRRIAGLPDREDDRLLHTAWTSELAESR